ncbi:MAG: DUF3887 domain-containing protein [Planctomycetes bacterium]|nr:DUF3887 domain-containing protein [Planctomycetota bacterium]
MMRYFILVTLMIVTTCLCPLFAEPPKENADKLAAAANQFVDYLVEGDFKMATRNFDATMTKALSPTKLKLSWKGLLLMHGALKSRGEIYREKTPDYDIFYVPCQFKQKALDVKIVFDKENKIAGLFFVPPKSQREYKLPTYVDTKAFHETETSVGDDPWKLPGTLAIPIGKGPFPAVVLVHGSGPNDRDETVGPNKLFKDLGLGLATKGVVTFRYDKRTKVHGVKMVSSKNPWTGKEETVDDVIAAVKMLKANAAVDVTRIFVVGHSLGGYLVPRIAAQNDEKLIAGFVLLAGSTRPIEDLMWEQLNYILKLDGTLSDADKKQLNELKEQIDKIKSPDLANEPPTSYIYGVNPSYWLDLRGYEPAMQATKVKQPMYILQGERDYQVTMKDFQNWKDALSLREDVQFKSYPSLNHHFIKGYGKSRPSEYGVRGNVSEAVINDISKWINRH